MKPARYLALILALLPAVPAAAGALTVDEIVDRHVAARGGLERWRAVRSLEVTGTQIAFSVASPFTLQRQRPNLYRFEQKLFDQGVVLVHDGTAPWWVHPILGVEEPAETPDPEGMMTRRAAEFEGVLIDHKAKGHKVELLGQEELDGQDTYKLKVTLKDGSEEIWHLDTKNFLEAARFAQATDLGREVPGWTYFSDFRTVEGLVIPHREDREYSIRHVALTIEKVRVNPEIDPERFKRPAPKPKPVEAPKEGETPKEG